ncbi:hypothetical protein GALL_439460 [mine drainage metagenome]|uniref:Uncharacterized protein n=1 Tax=mine drainage metagenome TaxID=410659 RepID=A0A1J5QEK2_9ZZZZ
MKGSRCADSPILAPLNQAESVRSALALWREHGINSVTMWSIPPRGSEKPYDEWADDNNHSLSVVYRGRLGTGNDLIESPRTHAVATSLFGGIKRMIGTVD